jgi:hypothetical protein
VNVELDERVVLVRLVAGIADLDTEHAVDACTRQADRALAMDDGVGGEFADQELGPWRRWAVWLGICLALSFPPPGSAIGSYGGRAFDSR